MPEVHAIVWLDHPTDGELLAHARKSFNAIGQLGADPSIEE